MIEKETNVLFPIFLKLDNRKVIIIGGGNVALEKLNALLANSPSSSIRLIAENINDEIKTLALTNTQVELIEKSYEPQDLKEADIVIAAVNDLKTSQRISGDARILGKLVNVADKPELCDFYLSSVVKKGNLKIAISTNGKSPTVAKRLKETFNDCLPDELDNVLDNMSAIRQKLNGDFASKVTTLNEVTKILATTGEIESKEGEQKWRKIASWSLFAFFFMILGHVILSNLPLAELIASIKTIPDYLDKNFYWMVMAGFLAQLVDGALGMGYGLISVTVLLSTGVNLPAISGSIHTAEMFSSGMSGYSHYKFGNVNMKLFKTMLIPGILGAVMGAFLLSTLGDQYANYLRPVLAAYALFLGFKILTNAVRKNKRSEVKRVGWLAGAGGFLDSFGGGGWGPLVTSTLVSKGRTPRFVIGTVSMTEFFVTLASAVTFFSLIGISHWQVILGLILGGTIAAPIAARLAGKLPIKASLLAVGVLVIIWSLRILVKAIMAL